ncbi:MAG: hypothetical protein NPIRA03_07490 [Nitrospirales bacterium]|nr:MAG: hypothetical protein NPIRA03_07490 [Nitrospirales bacterium]
MNLSRLPARLINSTYGIIEKTMGTGQIPNYEGAEITKNTNGGGRAIEMA